MKNFPKDIVIIWFDGAMMSKDDFVEVAAVKIADGYYVLPISSSPEIHDNTPAAYLTPNSNYDLALIVYILQTVIRLGNILGKDSEKWKSYIDGLQPFSVNKDGVLMLSRDEILQESHRHMSHCMSIYPLRLHKYFKAEDKRVIDATVEYTQALGHKYHVGYSLAWLANLQIVRRNGGKAYELLRVFLLRQLLPYQRRSHKAGHILPHIHSLYAGRQLLRARRRPGIPSI